MLLDPANTVFFLCDVQTKFKTSIHGYEHVIATANKMVKLAKLLNIRVVVTTQKSKALGPTDPDIDLESLGPLLHGPFDKTLFSMYIPEVKAILDDSHRPFFPTIHSIVVFGIETHICVLQTVLSLLPAPPKYTIHVVADGVSSCNPFEIPIALDRMRSEGASIGTSESIAFQLMRDASLPTFKAFSNFIKEGKESTKVSGEALLQGRLTAETGQAEGGVVIKSAM